MDRFYIANLISKVFYNCKYIKHFSYWVLLQTVWNAGFMNEYFMKVVSDTNSTR